MRVRRNCLWVGVVLLLASSSVARAEQPGPAPKTQEIWYHTGYPGGVSGADRGLSARMGPTKMPIIFAAIKRQRLVPPAQLHTDGAQGARPAASPIDLASLRAVHTDRYIKALLTGQPRSLACSQGLSSWSPAIARGWLLNVGGLYAAAEAALRKNTITANLGHGYHHATVERGGGFCTINGLAVVASKLVREGKARRVMIVDLDQHEGNGTAHCVIGDNRIWNVSIYGSNMGGPPAAPNNHVIRVNHAGLEQGARRDANYLATISSTLPGLISQHNPDLILYQAGMDPHDCAGVSPEALAVRDAYVFALARSMNKPVAWVLAGGYSDTQTLARLHTGTVKMANQVLTRMNAGSRLGSAGTSPYTWQARRGRVTFPDWQRLAGELRVTRPQAMDSDAVRRFAAQRNQLLQQQRLPDSEIQAAYRALIGGS
jgi:acetoin utilization deacetylase AcuC-like enzyme